MGAADTAIDFLQFLDVLHTSVSTKTSRILAQIGSVVGRTVDGVQAEWWQHVGLASRPSKPVAGKSSARAVVIRRGNTDAVIASEDDRGLELLGLLKEGETALYGAGETGTAQGRVLVKQDGSVNIFTTHDNTKDGRSVYFRVAPDGFALVAPWGQVKFDSTGFHVVHASGAAFNMGGIGGLPSPFDAISSYAKTTAGVVSSESSISANGGSGGASLASAPATQATIQALQAQLTAAQALLVAHSAAWAALAALPAVNPATVGPVSAAVATAAGIELPLFIASVAAAAAASVTIPTATTSS